MLASQDVSIYLNNALKPTHTQAELNCDAPLPEVIREMPDVVSGRFVELGDPLATEVEKAWKRVMILNATEVLYSFTYDPQTCGFTARKR